MPAGVSDAAAGSQPRPTHSRSENRRESSSEPRSGWPTAAPPWSGDNLSQLHSKQDFPKKSPLNLPASVSYLQSPIWISPCHVGLAETPGGGETKNNSRLTAPPLASVPRRVASARAALLHVLRKPVDMARWEWGPGSSGDRRDEKRAMKAPAARPLLPLHIATLLSNS